MSTSDFILNIQTLFLNTINHLSSYILMLFQRNLSSNCNKVLLLQSSFSFWLTSPSHSPPINCHVKTTFLHSLCFSRLTSSSALHFHVEYPCHSEIDFMKCSFLFILKSASKRQAHGDSSEEKLSVWRQRRKNNMQSNLRKKIHSLYLIDSCCSYLKDL